MAKRFTDSKKWNKIWFRTLSPTNKCFWYYVCDNCTKAGIWEVDFETASHYIGDNLKEDEIRDIFSKQYIPFRDGKKWILRDFIAFQYKKLRKGHLFHESIRDELRLEGVPDEILKSINTLSTGCLYPVDTPKEEEEVKEEVKDKEKVKGKKTLTPLQIVVTAYKVKTGHEPDDKGWDKLNFARFSKPAKQLLDYFGNWRDAVKCIDDVSDYFEKKNLSWTLETCCKWAADYKLKKEKYNGEKTAH